VARIRTTKKLAQRIDLNYFKRPTAYKRARLWLSLLATLLALLWIAGRTALKDHRVYSSGRLSEAHAVLERECAACHVQTAGVFSAKAEDSACLACHDGPPHHASQTQPPHCAECHSEHRGHINLRAASNQSCAECHGDLHTAGGTSNYANAIHTLADGHPQFAALRPFEGIPASDPGTIKLNHAIHMKPIRRGPNGPIVNLECGNCHRPTSVDADLTYADAKYRATTVTYKDNEEFRSMNTATLKPPKHVSGRELMAPVKFANACATCHLLTFDKRFDDGVPHDKPEVVHAFLVERFQQYIAVHPGEVRVLRDPGRDLTGRPLQAEVRVLTPSQWVEERTADAEQLLWRKTCKQCHTLAFSSKNSSDRIAAKFMRRSDPPAALASSIELPNIAPASITLKWMPHSKFDHDAHRGFTCEGCHEKALTSTEASDVLIPGIATCQTCHAPGPDHAESRCFQCHTYHDWAKRKEVKPAFTLPALHKGGR
jgi:hypothetical protein